jgi:hypothetical protein
MSGEPGVRYRRRDDVLWRQHAGVLVLALAGEPDAPPATLTGPASALWLALDQPTGLDELADLLADAFDADRTSVGRTLADLLGSLGAQGYVETVP